MVEDWGVDPADKQTWEENVLCVRRWYIRWKNRKVDQGTVGCRWEACNFKIRWSGWTSLRGWVSKAFTEKKEVIKEDILGSRLLGRGKCWAVWWPSARDVTGVMGKQQGAAWLEERAGGWEMRSERPRGARSFLLTWSPFPYGTIHSPGAAQVAPGFYFHSGSQLGTCGSVWRRFWFSQSGERMLLASSELRPGRLRNVL